MGTLHVILGAVSGIAREGGSSGRWSSLADTRAFGISVMGFGAVFSGLLILFGLMALMGWFFSRRKVAALEAGQPAPESAAGGSPGPEAAQEEPPAEAAEVESEPGEDDPFVLPETPAHRVPASLISSAAFALHLYDKGRLALGETRSLTVDGIPRTVTLLAAGFMNRARVDGEEIVFSQTRIAPEEAA
ncbi:MAG: OadG family protein [Pseudomonadota bacterium]